VEVNERMFEIYDGRYGLHGLSSASLGFRNRSCFVTSGRRRSMFIQVVRDIKSVSAAMRGFFLPGKREYVSTILDFKQCDYRKRL
jgi:hypothetical protein